MVNKVQLDPNAGQDTDVEFEADPNGELSETTPESGDESPDSDPGTTPEEQDALDAAGVNVNEADDAKTRKREFNLLKKDVRDYGTLYGGGKTSMINLAERIVEAAQKKAVTPADASNMYDIFKKAADAKSTTTEGVVPDEAAVENAPIVDKTESYDTQVRKIKDFITLGNTFDDDEMGAVDLIKRAKAIHFELLKADRTTLKKGSTYTILCGVAAAHVGAQAKRKVSQGPMTDDEIRKYLFVPKPADVGPADEWKKVQDALNSASAAKKGGRGEGARQPITSDTLAGQHLDRAIEALRECLGAGAPERLAAIEAEEAEAQRAIDEAAAKKAAKGKKAA